MHTATRYGDKLCKPEGVGSEFADIFIRLLDDAWLFGQMDLEAAKTDPGRFGINDSFPANMNVLHIMIARVSMAQELGWDDEDARNIEHEFGNILIFLRQLCEKYGIDLQAEYERKMHTTGRARTATAGSVFRCPLTWPWPSARPARTLTGRPGRPR